MGEYWVLVQLTRMNEVDRANPVDGLDVVSYDGCNYIRGVEFGGWCVAFLNHGERFAVPTHIERHVKTDEAFVLLAGEATLLIGESRREVRMECGKIYNVRKGTWHQIVTTPATRCLIVENADTGAVNSDRRDIAKL